MKNCNISQTKKIMRHLDRFGMITPVEAWRRYKIMRLAARINELRNRGAYIVSEKVHSRNGSTFARYVLI